MQCAAIMTTTPPTIRETETIAQAAHELITRRELAMAVVDERGTYVGMFGAEEFAGLMVPRIALAGDIASNLRFVENDPKPLAARFRELGNRSVREVTDRRAVAVFPDTPGMEAFRLFCRSRAPLPVIDPASRKFLGTVSWWDLLEAITVGVQ